MELRFVGRVQAQNHDHAVAGGPPKSLCHSAGDAPLPLLTWDLVIWVSFNGA